MAYTLEECRGEQYAVDWDIIARLRKSYWLSYYQLSHGQITNESESSILNPLSWSLPTIFSLNVNWPKVREDAKIAVFKDIIAYRNAALTDIRGVKSDISLGIEKTEEAKRMLKDRMKSIQAMNASSIEKSVDDYEDLIDGAKFVRDSSADIVLIGATILSGGAAAGLLAGGSAMKGIGKYQDTGSAGAAVIYGGGTLLLGAFKVKGLSVGGVSLPSVTKGGEYVLILAKGALETGTALVAGDTFGDAVTKGGLKIASAGSAQVLFSGPLLKKTLEKVPVPINITSKFVHKGQEFSVNEANVLLSKGLKKAAEKNAKSGFKQMTTFGDLDAKSSDMRRSSSGLIDESTMANFDLLEAAFVNMKDGIGHGL